MKRPSFDEVLKDYTEMLGRSEAFANACEAQTEANICKLLLERYPGIDPTSTVREVVAPAALAEIMAEAEAMTKAFMEAHIEQEARKLHSRLAGAVDAPAEKQ